MDTRIPFETGNHDWRVQLVIGSDVAHLDPGAMAALPLEASWQSNVLRPSDTVEVELLDDAGPHGVEWILHRRSQRDALAHAVGSTLMMVANLGIQDEVVIKGAFMGRPIIDNGDTGAELPWLGLGDFTEAAHELVESQR